VVGKTGDWSRTLRAGIAAFVVAAFALFGTLSADFLGRWDGSAAPGAGWSRSACS
jgi:NitT/TauT family transport system permease protein